MNKEKLIQLLYEQIPISKFMRVSVNDMNPRLVSLTCPLQPNQNHMGTAFGGSLSTMMILSAYCQVYTLIDGQGHVIIKASETKYLLPVTEDIISVSFSPEVKIKEKFLEAFQRKGKAQIQIAAHIELKNGQVGCQMIAQMVAVKI